MIDYLLIYSRKYCYTIILSLSSNKAFKMKYDDHITYINIYSQMWLFNLYQYKKYKFIRNSVCKHEQYFLEAHGETIEAIES